MAGEIFKIKSSSGFTLIELMIVLIIASLLASMAGTKIFKQIGKIKISSEEKKLEAIIENAKNISFTREAPLYLKFENNGLTVMNDEMALMDTAKFQLLIFENNLITFNANGFSDKNEVKYWVNQRKKSFSF